MLTLLVLVSPRPLLVLPAAAAVCSWVQVAAGRPVGIQLRPAEGESWRHSSVGVAMPRLSPVSAIQTFLDLWQGDRDGDWESLQQEVRNDVALPDHCREGAVVLPAV